MEMTKGHAIRAGYPCEGSLALKPQSGSGPRLVVHKGGRDIAGAVRPARSHALPLTASLSFLAVATIVCSLLFVGGSLAQERREAAFEAAFAGIPSTSVVVREGDSVWGIASRLDVDDADTAAISRWIAAHNDLGSGPLQPGQTLVVPRGC